MTFFYLFYGNTSVSVAECVLKEAHKQGFECKFSAMVSYKFFLQYKMNNTELNLFQFDHFTNVHVYILSYILYHPPFRKKKMKMKFKKILCFHPTSQFIKKIFLFTITFDEKRNTQKKKKMQPPTYILFFPFYPKVY